MQSSNDGGSNQQQQQWVALHYPVPPMLMPPPPYMAYHHHQPVTQSGDEENKSIWVGDLHNWMDEDYLRNCFASAGEVASIKVIRNKYTGISEGYGFVAFHSHATAEKVLQTYVSIVMPNTEQPFHLNWATINREDNKRSNSGSDLSIFVGDLAADLTDTLLHETFADKYPSVKDAKVVIDLKTRRSKGYGFVKFGDDNERNQAMKEMNGALCSSRPMRIAAATPRKSFAFQHGGGSMSNGGYLSDGDPNNTTIFVGGLDHNVSDGDLRELFTQYGEIRSVKIPIRKGCGFVQFANRNNAEEALVKLNGTAIGKQTVRLSWGRNASYKLRSNYGNQWQTAYYGGQIYDGYGTALQSPHGLRMYGGPYGSYAIYGAHQQQVS